MNSLCSKKSGQIFKQWQNATREKSPAKLNLLLTKHEAPFEVWAKSSKAQTDNSILWNSSCPEHKGKNIFMGKLFVTSLKDLSDNYFTDFVTRKIGATYVTTLAPRGESPTYLSNHKTFFTLSEMNSTYELSIDQNLHLTFEPSSTEFHPSYTTTCPKEMLKAGTKIKTVGIPLTHYCRSIWNSSIKDYETIMVSSYCP